jgi:hypothetical protein
MFRLVRQAYLRLRMGDAEMGRAVAIIEIWGSRGSEDDVDVLTRFDSVQSHR